MAEFEQVHGGVSGTSGVAYAGGAGSSGIGVGVGKIQGPGTAPKELERVRAGDRLNSPKDVERRQGRADRDGEQRIESPKTRDRSVSQPQLTSQSQAQSAQSQNQGQSRGSGQSADQNPRGFP
jgi:hypothetical protein